MSQLEPSSERRDRGAFFFGFAIALLVAVPISLVGLEALAENVTSLLVGTLVALLLLGVLGTLVFMFRRRLFRGAVGDLSSVYEPLPEAVRAVKSGEMPAASEAVELAARRAVRWYGWVALRRWIVGAMVGLVAAFGALLGSVLLWEQNRLMIVQNALIEKQNAFFQQQIRQDSAQWTVVQRASLRGRLSDVDCGRRKGRGPCPFTHGPVARASALRALVDLERSQTETVELVGLDLQGLDLRFFDLRGVRFVECNLRGAQLDHARLEGAVFPRSALGDASLLGSRVAAQDWVAATRAGGATGLRGADWTTCAGERLALAALGCDAPVFEATASAEALAGLVQLGPSSMPVAEVSLDGVPVVVHCEYAQALSCDLQSGPKAVGTKVRRLAGRLVLEPQSLWSGAVVLPHSVYQRLKLGELR